LRFLGQISLICCYLTGTDIFGTDPATLVLFRFIQSLATSKVSLNSSSVSYSHLPVVYITSNHFTAVQNIDATASLTLVSTGPAAIPTS
jgi:hypothetical protein